jgi:hypothetical protein
LTVLAPSPAERAAEQDVLECVSAMLAAEQARDGVAFRHHLHDSFVVRVDGEIMALGADAAVTAEIERWDRRDADVLDILDVDVVPPNAYVRFVLRDGSQRPRTVGYSVYEIHDQRALVASHYLHALAPPVEQAAPVAAVDAIGPTAPPVESVGSVDSVDATPEAPRSRRWTMPLAGIASWLAQDALLAAPVVAAAARYGTWQAFAALSSIYFCASLVASLFALRLLARRTRGSAPRVTAWLDQQVQHGAIIRALRAGRVFASFAAFVVGSYFMSAAPMVWALHELGVRRRLVPLAVISSAIWAAGFVGFYTGVAKLLGL